MILPQSLSSCTPLLSLSALSDMDPALWSHQITCCVLEGAFLLLGLCSYCALRVKYPSPSLSFAKPCPSFLAPCIFLQEAFLTTKPTEKKIFFFTSTLTRRPGLLEVYRAWSLPSRSSQLGKVHNLEKHTFWTHSLYHNFSV